MRTVSSIVSQCTTAGNGIAVQVGRNDGRRVRAEQDFVQRELAFTARFAPAELPAMFDPARDPSLAGEFVLVQGVVDLAVISPHGIWLPPALPELRKK